MKLTGLSWTQTGQAIRVRSGRQKCFEETASPFFTPNLSCTLFGKDSWRKKVQKSVPSDLLGTPFNELTFFFFPLSLVFS